MEGMPIAALRIAKSTGITGRLVIRLCPMPYPREGNLHIGLALAEQAAVGCLRRHERKCLRVGLALASGVSKLTDGSDHTRNPCSGADDIGRLAGGEVLFFSLRSPGLGSSQKERERRLANCRRRREPPQSQSENLAARLGPSKRQASGG